MGSGRSSSKSFGYQRLLLTQDVSGLAIWCQGNTTREAHGYQGCLKTSQNWRRNTTTMAKPFGVLEKRDDRLQATGKCGQAVPFCPSNRQSASATSRTHPLQKRVDRTSQQRLSHVSHVCVTLSRVSSTPKSKSWASWSLCWIRKRIKTHRESKNTRSFCPMSAVERQSDPADNYHALKTISQVTQATSQVTWRDLAVLQTLLPETPIISMPHSSNIMLKHSPTCINLRTAVSWGSTE